VFAFVNFNGYFISNSGHHRNQMVSVQSLIIAFLMSQTSLATVSAGERTTLPEPTAVNRQTDMGQHAMKHARMITATPLDRVATAVEGAESSHGKDIGMWRPDHPSGAQGPMQVSEAAAADVGGGDRLDLTQNRAIGRAYLALLHGRYRNWPDAIAAYNWGPGKMDTWVKAGRPAGGFLVGVATYLRRVLRDSGLCNGIEPNRLRQSAETEDSSDAREAAPDALIHSACMRLYSSHSSKDLYNITMVPLQSRSLFQEEAASARSSWLAAMQHFFGCRIASGESVRCS
jgi:transglycosylase-like protein with SLT domain